MMDEDAPGDWRRRGTTAIDLWQPIREKLGHSGRKESIPLWFEIRRYGP